MQVKIEIETKKLKATAISPANIAFIKFWGKKDPKINLPNNDSISMNMGSCLTTTTVEFIPSLKDDKIILNGIKIEGSKKDRVINILNEIRKMSGLKFKAKVISINNFPSDAGIASSASGFSALALAGSTAAQMHLNKKQLSILARLGSGSASRSIIDGFAIWKKAREHNTSYAVQLAKPSHWKVADIVAVTQSQGKKVSSTDGHLIAATSPFYKTRLFLLPKRIKKLKSTLLNKEFDKFGQILEEEAIELHIIAMTSHPAVFYWNKGTIEVIKKVQELRDRGISAYFTMDAGPNVHIICMQKDIGKVDKEIKKIPEVQFTIINYPSKGSHTSNKHLF